MKRNAPPATFETPSRSIVVEPIETPAKPAAPGPALAASEPSRREGDDDRPRPRP
jgi:hypothetical protein